MCEVGGERRRSSEPPLPLPPYLVSRPPTRPPSSCDAPLLARGGVLPPRDLRGLPRGGILGVLIPPPPLRKQNAPAPSPESIKLGFMFDFTVLSADPPQGRSGGGRSGGVHKNGAMPRVSAQKSEIQIQSCLYLVARKSDQKASFFLVKKILKIFSSKMAS